jgi:hypothetical protein
MVAEDVFGSRMMVYNRGKDGMLRFILMEQLLNLFLAFLYQYAGFDVLIIFEYSRFKSGITEVETDRVSQDE